MTRELMFKGAIPANLMPFKDDMSIDEPQYRRHLEWLANVPSVEAIVTNGHAAEVTSLTKQEQQRALAIAAETVGDKVKLIAGVTSESTAEAVELASNAKSEGVDGILVFPPNFFTWGANYRPEMAYRHFATLAEKVGIPMVIFQYPVADCGYSTEVLLKLIEIEQVVGIKEWSQDIVAFEQNLRAIHSSGRPVAVLSAYTASLYATYTLGADGCISGMGSVAADIQARLFTAVRTGDVETAKTLNDQHWELCQIFYANPFLDMHNRMKEALVMLDRLDSCVVRPPLQEVSSTERERIYNGLVKAGLLD